MLSFVRALLRTLCSVDGGFTLLDRWVLFTSNSRHYNLSSVHSSWHVKLLGLCFVQNGFLHLFDTSERLGIIDGTHFEGALCVMSFSADYKSLAVGTHQVLKCRVYLAYSSSYMYRLYLLAWFSWTGIALCGGSIQHEPADRGA